MVFTLLSKDYTIKGLSVKIFEPDKIKVMNCFRNHLIPFPYWSQVWPAATALAGFILEHPHYTQGKKVIELAAGLGLPSVVAAGNASSVIVSDYVEDALLAMQQTVAYNGLENMQVQLLDWYALPANLTTDVLLLSDVSYDATLFEVQEKVIRQFLQQGATVIISTPQRLVAKEAIRPLLCFCNYQEEVKVLHQDAEVLVTIMVLRL